MAFRFNEGFDISPMPPNFVILNEARYITQFCKDFAQKITVRLTARRVDRLRRRQVFKEFPGSHIS